MPRPFKKIFKAFPLFVLSTALFTLILISADAHAIRIIGGEPSSYVYTAETLEVANRQGRIVIGDVVWNCRGNRCVTEFTSGKPNVRDCKALSREIGGISSYGHEDAVLSPGALGRCNVGIYTAEISRGANASSSNASSPRSTEMDELREAASNCMNNERPAITFSAYPEVYEAWPRQYIQLSWSISDHIGRSWPHQVYLRRSAIQRANEPGAESVSPIWTMRVNVSDLPEGANVFYLTTYCGVSEVTINKAPKPVIEDATLYVLRGNEIRIRGHNFRNEDRSGVREVIVTEPGQTKALEVVSWNADEIVARVPEDILPGRRKLYIESGLDQGHRRASNQVPLTVVKRERYPSINIIQVLEELFTGADIHINNRGGRVKGSTHRPGDAYVTLGEEMGGDRIYMNIPEYSIDLGPDPEDQYNTRSVRYYVNDINMDAVRVSERGGGFEMTLYLETLHPEFQGDLLEENEFGAPPDIHVDNLSVKILFNLVAEEGLITLRVGGVGVEGDFRGSGPFCDYGPVNVCATLYPYFVSDILDQLKEAVEEILSSSENRAAIGGAIKPWLRYNGLTEVTDVKLDGQDLVIDYIP